ncbi:hypothetical protein ACE7GA_26430 (plasmid) [Roseomonas sp. CCTCC AB2023176]|uniref:hypothetical protein n=1 Tax=Roseomonas sp. CCTCC AB2023176 TaxID=3342640 RepID=UPI0035D54D12
MSESRIVDSAPLLTVRIESREPLGADEVGRFLSAIATDYRRFSRRQLVLVEVYQGSLVTVFSDLAELADKANHLIDFAKNLAMIAGAAAAGAYLLRNRRRPGTKTITVLAEAAAKHNCDVSIKYDGKTDIYDFKLEPRQAEELISHQATTLPAPKALSDAQASSLIVNEPGPIRDLKIFKDLESAVKLVTVKQPHLASLESEATKRDPVFQLIAGLVAIVRQRPDGHKLIMDLANSMRASGHPPMARFLERCGLE